jgi:copper(I)-binding protein
MTRSFVALAALTFLAVPAVAHEGMLHDGCPAGQTFAAGDITVSGAFSRATLPNAPVGAGYMSISNAGSAPDRLIGVSTAATPRVEIHNMRMEDGVMKMEKVEGGLEVPAGGSVSLSPEGYHIMLFKPTQPLVEGECLTLVLTFETAGELPVQLSVGGIGASDAPDHSGH